MNNAKAGKEGPSPGLGGFGRVAFERVCVSRARLRENGRRTSIEAPLPYTALED